MYVFILIEDEERPESCEAILHEKGLRASFVKKLGEGRHVFTHRIWEMQYFLFELSEMPDEAVLGEMDAFLADAETLRNLPIPSAMKGALNIALQLLEKV